MTHAYQQLVLEKESKKNTTVNITHGLFYYNRLHYRVPLSPRYVARYVGPVYTDTLTKGTSCMGGINPVTLVHRMHGSSGNIQLLG